METNRLGFCRHHFQMMLAQRNRLSVALTLESHLKELQKEFDAIAERGASKGQPLELLKREASCFVCDKVQWGMERMLATIFRLWQGEPDFAKLYGEQPCLCLPHAAVLLQEGQKQIHKKKYGDFSKITAQLAKKYLDEVNISTRSPGISANTVLCMITETPVGTGGTPGTPLSGQYGF